ncbi:DUF6924 domain-containing protein [Smaragdicoccus niigatensis]|uniref:DUF6924 domain-containing protein n=1 Tax=Smaragdicoccus niigatensis TaxID=359359 RepID=UPI000364844C|nr:hypothetical protein [Smaragdicoccus niigatensis]
MTQSGPPLIVFNQEITPRDHLIRLTNPDAPVAHPLATLIGQHNGLLGAAVAGQLFLATATSDDPVRLRIEVLDSSPEMDTRWQDIVEVSFTPQSIPLSLVGADSEMYPLGLMGGFESGRTYRVRYCVNGFGSTSPTVQDAYQLQLWPAPIAPDVIVNQTSAAANRWHRATKDAAENLRVVEAEIARLESERIAALSAEPESPFPPGQSLLIRTDFTNEAAWEETVEAAMEPLDLGGIEAWANLTLVDDPQFDSMPVDDLRTFVTDYSWTFVADSRTITDPEHPILALNNDEFDPELAKYPTLRVVPRQMFWIESNLSIANMSFSSFASSADPDGVFRGFPD